MTDNQEPIVDFISPPDPIVPNKLNVNAERGPGPAKVYGDYAAIFPPTTGTPKTLADMKFEMSRADKKAPLVHNRFTNEVGVDRTFWSCTKYAIDLRFDPFLRNRLLDAVYTFDSSYAYDNLEVMSYECCQYKEGDFFRMHKDFSPDHSEVKFIAYFMIDKTDNLRGGSINLYNDDDSILMVPGCTLIFHAQQGYEVRTVQEGEVSYIHVQVGVKR